MLKRWGLLLVVLGCLVWVGIWGNGIQTLKTSSAGVAKAAGIHLPLVGRRESAHATPIESIVQPKSLQRTYYYHFAKGVDPDFKPLFDKAIAVYNETGIVNLVAGKPTTFQNGLTFFIYEKEMPRANFLELGEGGPEIKHGLSYRTPSLNLARAGLNVTYPAGQETSVAIHEIGHALGLDHSKDRSSVMYPIDQGHTKLSPGDIKALKLIYTGQMQ